MGGLRRWALAVVVPGALLAVVVLAGASALGAPTAAPDRSADDAAEWATPGRVELAVPVRLAERPATPVALALLGPAAVVALAFLGPDVRARPWFRLAGGDLGPAPRRRRPTGVRRRAPPSARPA